MVSAQVESELVSLDSEDPRRILRCAGSHAGGLRLTSTGAHRLRHARPDHLLHVGPTESRAWTIREGWLAPQAAGVIHGDFERGFIKAETVGYEAPR